ncbi:type II toxin-antitoxin system VapC family toxin [Candidatus Berkelbacteria bacterium]|uniref:Twitching motility protein PilT n=1 Tax=Candidatus Berkelbacteria bacterium CG10_big_fil_rev_8_21_14_0_10_43_14 TaxID=1974515 RepID=A0A2M6R9L7_9BACT|nr:type II toxin-antitoxin system VapC family toxin [Candidatus Berkelbacteria bacterium]OIP06051.1 MAG: hypothetical protein AUK41_03500 [Candidatus Berkelbacteria bacterium CG2_30_43_20]PIS07245.1 MAG: twitching motility protein PilT [Candidatus Berkelbacteria bacterium CG10_big_fil_rev_8_21_14_0_10_43_14]PIU87270.1 MAG: twitching motility protein PilT [Candidatus Berkelbacteria bacterium CG06_land_8_20_14_3_00_43_10]
MIVLDSSALIAYFKFEKGDTVVGGLLKQSTGISCVNLAETLIIFKFYHFPGDEITSQLSSLKLEVIDCSKEIALIAAEITHPKNMFLSLGDRICLATAISKKCPILTADSSWEKLKLPIEVISIR